MTGARYDADVASVASLIGDPSRGTMLLALTEADSLSLSELARLAGVSLPTASEHVRRLEEAGLLRSARQGRARFISLAGRDVATALESLAAIAPPSPVRSLWQSIAASKLAVARTCYDHLAGRFGVALLAEMVRRRALIVSEPLLYEVTRGGERLLGDLGVDVNAMRAGRRALARACTDWTERKPHLGGAVGAAICGATRDRGWAISRDRVVHLTEAGRDGFRSWLGPRSLVATILDEMVAGTRRQR